MVKLAGCHKISAGWSEAIKETKTTLLNHSSKTEQGVSSPTTNNGTQTRSVHQTIMGFCNPLENSTQAPSHIWLTSHIRRGCWHSHTWLLECLRKKLWNWGTFAAEGGASELTVLSMHSSTVKRDSASRKEEVRVSGGVDRRTPASDWLRS